MFKPKVQNAIPQAVAVYRPPPIHVDSSRAAPVRMLGGPKTINSPLVRRYIK